MNVVCRVCRSWILRQRIQAQLPQIERVAFAWSHDAVLAQTLASAAGDRVARDISLFNEGAELRIALFSALLEGFRRYQHDYQEVLSFAPAERMSAARKPMVRRVRQAFRQLDEIQRVIVSMVDLGACSYEEIERVLSISRSELLEHLCCARVQLKTSLFGSMSGATSATGQMLWSVK